MKDNYKASVSLSCITCGGEDFDFNEDKSYVKCTNCEREYYGGYNELVGFNQEKINEGIDKFKKEVTKDLESGVIKAFKDAFKGNKFIKVK